MKILLDNVAGAAEGIIRKICKDRDIEIIDLELVQIMFICS
jgi:hypothetical protein